MSQLITKVVRNVEGNWFEVNETDGHVVLVRFFDNENHQFGRICKFPSKVEKVTVDNIGEVTGDTLIHLGSDGNWSSTDLLFFGVEGDFHRNPYSLPYSDSGHGEDWMVEGVDHVFENYTREETKSLRFVVEKVMDWSREENIGGVEELRVVEIVLQRLTSDGGPRARSMSGLDFGKKIG